MALFLDHEPNGFAPRRFMWYQNYPNLSYPKKWSVINC